MGLPVRVDFVIAQYSKYRHIVHSLCNESPLKSSLLGIAAANRAKWRSAERSFRREDFARTVVSLRRAPESSRLNTLRIDPIL